MLLLFGRQVLRLVWRIVQIRNRRIRIVEGWTFIVSVLWLIWQVRSKCVVGCTDSVGLCRRWEPLTIILILMLQRTVLVWRIWNRIRYISTIVIRFSHKVVIERLRGWAERSLLSWWWQSRCVLSSLYRGRVSIWRLLAYGGQTTMPLFIWISVYELVTPAKHGY